MREGLLTMSEQEVERVGLIRQVTEGRLTQVEAGKRLDLTTRQIRRLVRAYERKGAAGLISKKRGKPGNRHHTCETKEKVKKFVEQYYVDFGPTFAAEKLEERHHLIVNRETLRQWMSQWGLWSAKNSEKKLAVHQMRERRPCFGELVQIDGSHHDWFEGRAEKCCALVFIDDATSRLLGLRFEAQETTAGYFKLVRAHIESHGKPVAYYSDKFGVFRVNHANCYDSETQFGRAMRELGIGSICANSPQAKGRVEKANRTLQDRLIKEMRLRKIDTMEEANNYALEFIEFWNKRFAVEPKSLVDAHRPNLLDSNKLDLIFSYQDKRILSKNLECSFDKTIYQIKTELKGYRLRHAKVTICKDTVGSVKIIYKGKILDYTCYKKQRHSGEIVNTKQLEKKILTAIKRNTPSKKHPWRKGFSHPKSASSNLLQRKLA